MKIVIAILVIGGLAAGAFYWKPWQQTEAESTSEEEGYYTVSRGDIPMTLTERGTLKTQDAQAVRSQISGRARIEWLVEEGARVEPGQILVELDKTDLEKEIEELDNKVIQLESELKAADTEVTIQTAQNLTDTEKANLAHEVAVVSLKKYEEGDVRQERRRLLLAIKKAKIDVERAEFRFETLPDMLEKDFITKDQYKEEELKRDTAEQDLESANLASALYEEYQYPLDLKEKKAAVTEAERNVDRANKQAEARLEGKKALVRQKTRSLEAATERLKRANDDINHMTLRSKRGGTVFYGDPDNSRRAEEIKVGAEVWPNRTILTIPDPTRMLAVVKVHEADISKVSEGGRAIVRSEIKRNESYGGQVLRIGSVANAGNRRYGDSVRRFDVEVGLESGQSVLKPGTTAEVELDLGTVTNVLFVPLQAVHPRDGRFYAYKRISGRPTRVRVKLGRANESYVEVVRGLDENDEVLLYAPEPGEAEVLDEEDDADDAEEADRVIPDSDPEDADAEDSGYEAPSKPAGSSKRGRRGAGGSDGAQAGGGDRAKRGSQWSGRGERPAGEGRPSRSGGSSGGERSRGSRGDRSGGGRPGN